MTRSTNGKKPRKRPQSNLGNYASAFDDWVSAFFGIFADAWRELQSDKPKGGKPACKCKHKHKSKPRRNKRRCR